MNSARYASAIPRSYRTMCKDVQYSSIVTSPFLRRLHQTTRTSKDSPPAPSSPSTNTSHQHENQSNPSFNLFQQVREARPAVRYTVYAGVALMVTAESTFWFNVIKARFFPSAIEEEKKEADELLERIGNAVKGFRKVWMRNYGRYYGAHLWGLGYGGLDGLEDEQQ